MILELTLSKDKQNKITNTPSLYNPSDDVKKRTSQVLADFGRANTIRNQSYREFNNNSLANRISLDQMSYNQFVQVDTTDPAAAWRSAAFRPIVRNRVITIASHVTASVIYPKVFAQNENDQEDKDAAMVMRDLLEWTFVQSKYEEKFMQSVLAALVNPCSFIHTEFVRVFRNVKKIQPDGTWVEEEIEDELFSGFQDTIVPVDEIWIADIYEQDLQKQPFLVWRRVIDYTTAKAKYKDNEIFEKYVRPGVQFLYSDQQNLFYEVYDQSQAGNLVEEVIYYNRTADLQLVFLNGILITDVDQPNPRDDKLYPFAKTGYEFIDEGRFFYYKSLPFKLQPDEDVINTLYRMIIDGTYLQVMPPSVVFGNNEITSAVIAPGMVTTINTDNPNASFQTLATNNNLTAGFNMLEKVESSVNESAVDPLQSGIGATAPQTAYEVSRLETNAKIMFEMFAKMVGKLVKDWATLRIGDIIQHLTVADASKILTPEDALRFRTFVIPEREVNGTKKTRRIEFNGDLPDDVIDERELIAMQEEMLNTEEDEDIDLVKVNPTLLRKLKYLIHIVPDMVLPKSDAQRKALMLEEYSLAISNPYVDQVAITKDLLLGAFEKTANDPDKYMADLPQQPQGPEGQLQTELEQDPNAVPQPPVTPK